MAQTVSSRAGQSLIYPQVRRPGFGRWFIACWCGVIGGGFVSISILAIRSAIQGNSHGPPALLGLFFLFFLIGLGIVTYVVAILLYRHHIVIDPQTRTVTRRRSWGPIVRTLLLPGEVRSVLLMHFSHSGGRKSNSSYTVCVMKVMTRQGEGWQLKERPEAGEMIRRMLPSFFPRTAPDYERELRDEAIKLCAATGWRLDDRLEPATREFIPAASRPQAQRVEDIKPAIAPPAWLDRPIPRQVRQRRQTVLLGLLGWGVIAVPLLAAAIWLGVRIWDAQSMRTTTANVIGLAHHWIPGGDGVDYRFAVDGREYTRWEMNVSPAIWAEAQPRESILVSYLPRDPNHSYIGPPQLAELLPENWMTTSLSVMPGLIVAIGIAIGMRRRAKRIALARLLGERGRMSQGMVFRRSMKAGSSRNQLRVAINGVPVFNPWLPPVDDPNQIRYEFIVDGNKRFGYVPADLLGIFRPDGLVGVVYDPLYPDGHLPLPVIERYLRVVV